MQTFDIIFGIFSFILVVLGIKRGFIEEVMRLLAVIAGFIGALIFYRRFIPQIAFLKLPHEMAGVASFLIIFLGVMIAIVLIGKIVKKVISLTMLGWVDRLCGGCFGILKAFFLGWVFVIAIMALPFPDFATTLKASRTFSFFATISPVLKNQISGLGGVPLHKIPQGNTFSGLTDTFKKLWKKDKTPAMAVPDTVIKKPRKTTKKSISSKLPSVNSDSI